MSSGKPVPTERDPRTLALLGLGLLIWLGSAVAHRLPLAPPLFPTTQNQAGLTTAGEGVPPELGGAAPAGKQSGQGRNEAALALVSFQPIPINRANTEALIALDGIGPVLAGRIIEWRTTHGRFRSADDLLDVRGIGPKKLAKIIPQITFQ